MKLVQHEPFHVLTAAAGRAQFPVMNDTPTDREKIPTETPDKTGRRKEREARLAEALRANLKRRKAQERGRAADKGADREGSRDPESE